MILESTQLRVDEPQAAPLPPDPLTWRREGATWRADGTASARGAMLVSPPVTLEADKLHVFSLVVDRVDGDGVVVALRRTQDGATLMSRRVAEARDAIVAVSRVGQAGDSVELVLRNDGATRAFFSDAALDSYAAPIAAPFAPAARTELDHWNAAQRWIHRRCKESRAFNTLVSAVEMRLGREEVLSLPQYVALCPTGQCNALCAFCSVTINRTGIVKKQMPLSSVAAFLEPMRRTVRLYGVEGNGEPTLHSGFAEFLRMLIGGGARAYLISNGSRLDRRQVALLQADGVDAINFSLNAATAETHRAVMKLKEFDRVVDGIRKLARGRGELAGRGKSPTVAVSFVVTRQNVHEAVEFARFADRELGVDQIHIRPLSELGDDLGTVEDVRGLEPLAADVADMLDGLDDLRALEAPRATLFYDRAAFRAVRADRPDRVVMPTGFDGRLLAPRPMAWRRSGDADAAWQDAAVRIDARATAGAPVAIECGPIPVDSGARLKLVFDATVLRGGGRIEVRASDGTLLADAALEPTQGVAAASTLDVDVGAHGAVGIAVRIGADGFEGTLDFRRLRTPAPAPAGAPRLPHKGRWEAPLADARIAWDDGAVALTRDGVAGPYILKSYAIECLPGQAVRLPVAADVRAGELGLGVLDETSATFLATWRFAPGRHETVLAFDTGANRAFRVVAYAAADGALDARVDWRGAIEPEPAWHEAPPAPPPPEAAAPTREPAWRRKLRTAGRLFAEPAQWRHVAYSKWLRVRAALARRFAPALSALRLLVHGRPRYLCQKPWTDLANFSVDGRMDVCCIATGASQERFALGNAFAQEFRDIWNGERAREFRRTVNGPAPLPPCARCPMAYGYQGPLFDPKHTAALVRDEFVGRRLLGWLTGWRGAGLLQWPVYRPLRAILYAPAALALALWFRGFKRR